MGEVIIDVREKDEFDSEHIEHSIHVPLSRFTLVAPGVLNRLQENQVLIMCRGGNRACLAQTQISQLGYGDKIQAKVFEGGMVEWKKQGLPTLIHKKGHLPIMRQVQLVAGFVVFANTIVALFVNP